MMPDTGLSLPLAVRQPDAERLQVLRVGLHATMDLWPGCLRRADQRGIPQEWPAVQH